MVVWISYKQSNRSIGIITIINSSIEKYIESELNFQWKHKSPQGKSARKVSETGAQILS